MKINQVCSQTGLTDRTVRFYIEKGLLKTNSEIINGRICRDYSEEDIRLLNDISTLRKARFSIQDILDMQASPSDIPAIVLRHYTELEAESNSCSSIAKSLNKYCKTQNISWRELANLLSKDMTNYYDNIRFYWRDEDSADIDEQNNSFKVKKIAIILLTLCVIMLSLLQWKYNEPVVAVFAISDVTFHDKWVDSEKIFVSISCSQNAPIGYDNYFFSLQTLQLESSDYYESISVKTIPYQSVSIRITIPYGAALKNGLLHNKNSLQIEKILSDKNLITKYCIIEKFCSTNKHLNSFQSLYCT